ncbi:MAG: response regulator transcription factor [Candidatus Electryonea clarkiae]|nr:response regulator transcription factor [Candidatus Electryonea clarkiae]MDP8285488.1 response regulator transcription factor [Candidatus Electryonea clarkiae]
MKTSILIIEFDPVIGRTLQNGFESEGYRVILFRDGRSGLEFALNNHLDLMVLNLMIPGINGWQVLRKLRQKAQSIPVIAISVQDREEVKVRAFNEGCDDFLTIPFSLRVSCRTRAILLRTCPEKHVPNLLKSGGLVLDCLSGQADWNGKEINLTRIEFMILTLLVRGEGRVVLRYQIMDEIWGEETDVTTRTVDMHIHRIRTKLPDLGKRIETVYQRGYKLNQM